MTQSIVIDGIRIAFETRGVGVPVVLLHGFPLNRRMWDPQLDALSSSAQLIAIDLRGHGESDAPLWRYTMERFGDDVLAVLDHLRVARAVFVGLSMGGYIALSVMRRHADRVQALVLTDTKAQADTEQGRAGRFHMAQAAHRHGGAPVADAMLPKLLAPETHRTQPALVRHVRSMIEGMAVSGIAGDLMAMADRPDSVPLLSTIHCPTLVIVGESDQATPVADARLMAETIPGAHLAIIPQAGHLPNLEAPQRFNDVLGHFLAALNPPPHSPIR